MKEGDIVDNPETMTIESIDEENQTAVVSWVDEKSGLHCTCVVPLDSLKKVVFN